MNPLHAILSSIALASIAGAQTGINWNDVNGGTLAGSTVAVSGFGSPFLGAYDLSTADFAGAPLASNQVCMDYEVNSSWSASFAPALDGVLWYGKFIRGSFAQTGGAPSVTYTFNHPFSILSGFAQGSVTGNTLSLPETSFHDGILQFSGSITTLTCTTNALGFSAQVCNLGHMNSNSGAEYCAEAVYTCPCFVVSAVGEGCPNSTGAGATLVGAGVASVGASTFSLTAAQLPDTVGLFVQGTNAIGGVDGNPVGEGRLCLGPQKRYQPQSIVGGTVSRSNFQNFATVGGVMNYQFWYRDPANTCAGGGFSFSPAWNVTWMP